MSNQPTPPFMRHALGMPAGSVRAMLALFILLYLWVVALVPGVLKQPMASTSFVFTQLVMVLILCHFTVAHGKTIGTHTSRHSPLWLPRGSLRGLLLVGYFGLAYYTYQLWTKQPDKDVIPIPDTEPILIVLSVVMAAFLLGHLSTNVIRWLSGGQVPFWFQDVQAWFSLISLVLLGYVLIVRLVMNPTMKDEANKLTLMYTEPAMVTFVAFYFGARS